MVTTIATVTAEGLALTLEFMHQLELQPGARVCVSIEPQAASLPSDLQDLRKRMRGILAGDLDLVTELQQERRKDASRSKW